MSESTQDQYPISEAEAAYFESMRQAIPSQTLELVPIGQLTDNVGKAAAEHGLESEQYRAAYQALREAQERLYQGYQWSMQEQYILAAYLSTVRQAKVDGTVPQVLVQPAELLEEGRLLHIYKVEHQESAIDTSQKGGVIH